MAATATTTIELRKDEADRLLTEAQAADRLSVKPQTLAVWRTSKRYALPYVKVGRAVRYRESAVERFIEERTEAGDSR